MSMTIVLVALLAGLLMVAVLAYAFFRANQVNLTQSGDQKPDWMRETPPPQTVEATLASGDGIQIFGQTPGEKLASPFAEQIEDILRARLLAHPELSHYQIDLGTSEDSALEIWINGDKFSSIDELPDERLREVFQQAVDEW